MRRCEGVSQILPHKSADSSPRSVAVQEQLVLVMVRNIFPAAQVRRPLKNTIKACFHFAAGLAPNHYRRLVQIACESTGDQRSRALTKGRFHSALSNRTAVALGKLRNPISHGALIKLLLDADAISLEQAYLWANGIFSDRNFDELNSFFALDIADLHPVQEYLRERMNEYRGLSAINVGDLLPIIENDARYRFLLRNVLNLYVQQLCQLRHVGEATRVVSSHDLKLFAPPTFLGLIRAIIETGQMKDAVELLGRFLSGSRPLTQLYFHELATTLADQRLTDIPLDATWRKLLEIYADHYSPVDEDDARDVLRYLVEPLRRIPNDDRDLMDIRSSQDQRDKLTRLIVANLRNKKPLSLIRLGDGEAYCFDTSDLPSEIRKRCAEDNLVREVHWWGTHIPESVRACIRREAFSAVSNADIIGIPGVHRLIRDRGNLSRRLVDTRQKRGLAVVLPATLNQTTPGRIYTEERVHQVIFDAAYLSALSQHAHRTIVVSCWGHDKLVGMDLRNPEFIVISGATKVRDTVDRPLFETYEETIARIIELSAPGVLCLVGGGLIGKIFIDAAKQQGAVALDVGSVMDYIAGRATRNIADILMPAVA